MKLDDSKRLYHYIVTIHDKFRIRNNKVKAICDYYRKELENEFSENSIIVRGIVFEKRNTIGKPHIHIAFECDFITPLEDIVDKINKINLDLNHYMTYKRLKSYPTEPILYNTSARAMCKHYNKGSCPGKSNCNKVTPLHPTLLKCQLPSILIPCTEQVNSSRDGKLLLNNNRHIENLYKYLKRKEGCSNTLHYFDNGMEL